MKQVPGLLHAITLILATATASAEDGRDTDDSVRITSRQLATLANPDILESSGLAISRETPGLFWTHNDSGDGPRLFAFDESGSDRGVVSLDQVTPVDWEDVASFRRDGRGWLLVADVGDNAKRRNTCQLLVVPEPKLGETTAMVDSTVNFRFEGGPRDCEAMGMDVTTNTVLFVAKAALSSGVFALELPTHLDQEVKIAKRIVPVSVPFATAMDITSDGRHAIVLTYANAFEFHRNDNESWETSFKRPPRILKMPLRKQGESICYGADNRTLYLTSERVPTPLWKVERPIAR